MDKRSLTQLHNKTRMMEVGCHDLVSDLNLCEFPETTVPDSYWLNYDTDVRVCLVQE